MKCYFFNFRLQKYTFNPYFVQKYFFFAHNRHFYFYFHTFIFIFVIYAIKLQLRSNHFRLLFPIDLFYLTQIQSTFSHD